jgi:tetratricopeptide (TPR) repeat protein
MTHELRSQLASLEAANILRQVQPGADAEYWFKHTMIQDAIYGSLLKSTRADLHRRVAEVAEQLTPIDSEDRAPTLALHYERAGLVQPAFRYLLQAGQQALRRYAYREALGFFDRALALIGDDQPIDCGQVCEVYAGRGDALKALGQHLAARDNFEAMYRHAAKTGGPAEQADALIRLVTVEVLISGLSEGKVEKLNEAVKLARESGSPLLQAQALWNLGLAYRFEDPAASFPYFEQAAAIAREHREDPKMRELLAYVLTDFSVASFVRGDFGNAGRYVDESVVIFRALDDRGMVADNLGTLSQLYYANGNPEAARRAAREALEISRSIENHWGIAYGSIGLVMADIDAGAFEAALAVAQEALAHARQISFPVMIGLTGLGAMNCLYQLGKLDEVPAYAEETSRAFGRIPAPHWSAMSRSSAAVAHLVRGDPAGAWATLAGLPEEIETQQNHMRGVAMFCGIIAEVGIMSGHYDEMRRFCDWILPYLENEGLLRYLAEMRYWGARRAAAQGDHATALALLSQARPSLEQMDVAVLLWRVDAALGVSLAATGDHVGATAAHERSVAIIQKVAAGIGHPGLRASFLARADVQEVLRGRA